MCNNFDVPSYDLIFQSYERRRELPVLGEQLSGNMLQAVEQGLQTMLFTAIAAHADVDGLAVEQLQALHIHQLAPLLKPDSLVTSLVSCAQVGNCTPLAGVPFPRKRESPRLAGAPCAPGMSNSLACILPHGACCLKSDFAGLEQVVCEQVLSIEGILQATHGHVQRLVDHEVDACLARGESEPADKMARDRALLLSPLGVLWEDFNLQTDARAENSEDSTTGKQSGDGLAGNVEEEAGAESSKQHWQGCGEPDGGSDRRSQTPDPSLAPTPMLSAHGQAGETPSQRDLPAEAKATATSGMSEDGGSGSMGSKWGGRMWGHMKKAAASTASGLKSVGGEDAQKALAILAGTDADPVPPVVGSLARGAGDGRAGGDDISVEMRAMMSAAASATVRPASTLASRHCSVALCTGLP